MGKNQIYPWVIFFFVVISINVLLVYLSIRLPEYTPVWKGREIANKYGCFNCHGFEGQGGIKNPNYKYGEVPSWQGETAMMFIVDENDIKEWILYGKPKRLEKIDHGGLIKMPAYEKVISEKELKNLTIYLKAVMGLIQINDEKAKIGFEIAKKNGCFGCHGPYGMGGMPNPKSLKGYIPGWDGPDFAKLVKNDDELKEWITNGIIERLKKNKFAKRFIEQQIVKMPAYKDVLTDEEVEEIIYYIKWLRGQKF